VRDQTHLLCEFGANPFSGSRDISYTNKNKCSAVAELGNHLVTTDMGQKLGAVPLFLGGGAGSPSNTMSPGPRTISIPSGT